MENPQLSEIEVQDVDHLGLIAGIVDAMGLVEIINHRLGTHPLEAVSAGIVVKALILNCFGFLSGPLYLFSQFFAGKAVSHLLGEDIRAEYLNDSRIGRVLDDLYRYGLSRLFAEIAMKAAQIFGVDGRRVHLDGSSVSVQGAYLTEASPDHLASKSQEETTPPSAAASADTEAAAGMSEPDTPVPITITHGYSRDKRPDLKQFTVSLICSSDHDVPLFFQVGNGNDSETQVFPQVIQEFRSQWTLDELEVVSADAALYSETNLQTLGQTPWIIRVPATLAQAPWLLEHLRPDQFSPSRREGYSFVEVGSYYGGIAQRWLIVESQARQTADLKQLDKRIRTLTSQKTKALNPLFSESFACEADANAALCAFETTLKYHRLSEATVVQKAHYFGKGRPSKDATPSHYTYHPTAQLQLNPGAMAIAQAKAGRFIIATNRLQLDPLEAIDVTKDNSIASPLSPEFAAANQPGTFNVHQWPPDEILSEYKAQQACVRVALPEAVKRLSVSQRPPVFRLSGVSQEDSTGRGLGHGDGTLFVGVYVGPTTVTSVLGASAANRPRPEGQTHGSPHVAMDSPMFPYGSFNLGQWDEGWHQAHPGTAPYSQLLGLTVPTILFSELANLLNVGSIICLIY